MSCVRHICEGCALVLLALRLMHGTATAEPQSSDIVTGTSTSHPTVVLLALDNHTRDARAPEVFDSLLLDRITDLPLSLVTGTELRDILRKHRIRAVGGVGLAGARTLRKEFDADYVLTGSYDVYIHHQRTPELGLSLRLTDLHTHQVVWAQSAGATGADYETVLGLGHVDSIAILAQRVVDEVLGGLGNALVNPDPSASVSGELVAMVPFDDVLVDFPGGGVVSAQVLTHLVERGFNTIEPGAVREFFITFQRFSRGGIDHEVLTALHDSLGVTLVVTGSVDGFHQGIPELEQSFPEMSVSGRCIDADTRSIISVAVVSATGDHETVIGLGNTRAANDLAHATTSTMLDKLDLKEGHRDERQ